MLIQICTARADIPATGEGIAFVRGETGPAIAAMSGNQGFVMGTDRSSGRYIATAAWSDRESYETHSGLTPALIADMTRHLDIGEPIVEVFDLAETYVVKPVRVGYWGRLNRFRISAREAETGDGYSVEWYDSLPRLRHSRAVIAESGAVSSTG